MIGMIGIVGKSMNKNSNCKVLIIGTGSNILNIIDILRKKNIEVDVEAVIEKSVEDAKLNLAIPRISDILFDMNEDKSREHYQKVAAPPPPWKRK